MQSELSPQFDGSFLTDSMIQQVTDQLSTYLLLGTIASAAIFIPLLILYILSTVRKHKVQTAIFDIQKTLREINDRQAATHSPTTPMSPVNTTPHSTSTQIE